MVEETSQPNTYVTGTGQIIDNVHAASKCDGTWCVIHRPAPGPWKDWPTDWRGDKTIFVDSQYGLVEINVDIWRGFERRCPHGYGHTAVEETLRGNDPHMHGCDGCPCGPEHLEAEVDGTLG